MTPIDRDELQKCLERGEVTLIEVLERNEYDDAHIAGAINVPLTSDFEKRIAAVIPDRSRPIVLYCGGEGSDLSDKATHRLEQLGYDRVRSYRGGKADWRAAGLPIER